LFFTHTSSQIGGVGGWLDRASEHFSRQGFDPVVGLVRGIKFNDPARYTEHHPGLQSVEVDGRGCNREGRVRALARTIRRVRPAIVIPLGIVDANEAAIRRKLSGQDLRLLARTQGNLLPMLADLAAYRDWIDLAVCPGRLTFRVLLEWAGFDPSRVLNIPNGAKPPIALRRPRAPGSPIRIGYVGRMTKDDKRATDLVPFCRELAALGCDFRLVVAGDGPCLEDIRSALAHEGERVRFLGAVKHPALYEDVFPNLDVLLMTSATEAFSNVLVEAMAHGLAPVVSRFDGLEVEGLILDRENALTFPVGDMRQAARAVDGLARDDVLLERLSQAALRRSVDYSSPRTLARWVQALHELAGRAPVFGASVPQIPVPESSGSLDRLGVPAAAVDFLRRMRRAAFGPSVPAGGEEWPLHYQHHASEALDSIRSAIGRIDVAATDRAEPASTVRR
jgi:glycosyltransferase involved in cell wall biosynthesis